MAEIALKIAMMVNQGSESQISPTPPLNEGSEIELPPFRIIQVVYQDKNQPIIFQGKIQYFGVLSEIDEKYHRTLAEFVKNGKIQIEETEENQFQALDLPQVVESDELVFMKHGEGHLIGRNEVTILISGIWELDKLEGKVEVRRLESIPETDESRLVHREEIYCVRGLIADPENDSEQVTPNMVRLEQNKYIYQDGKGLMYVGSFLECLFHGKGILIVNKGGDRVQYDGEFSFGLKHGRGELSMDDFKFVGNFKNEKYDGFGIVKTSKLEYKGFFKNNLFNGQGRMTFPNGISYDGEFTNSRLNGVGRITTQSNVELVGFFKDSEFGNFARITYPEGYIYEGSIKELQRNGLGVQTFSDNTKIKGMWLQDKFLGAALPVSLTLLACYATYLLI